MGVLVDEYHGQLNWGQTGFPSRQLATTFAGIGNQLRSMGYRCQATTHRLTKSKLAGARALIIPPPAGKFKVTSIFGGDWIPDHDKYYSGEEIDAVLSYVETGGSLLAFSYRFGDTFTKTNLGHLTSRLGWSINNDAVIDLQLVGKEHPLHTTFETKAENIGPRWAAAGVASVIWRPVTTFSLLPGATGQAVVSSPTSCSRFTIEGHKISHETTPVCVLGTYGSGRFALLGGPHAFEETELGFLSLPGNSRLLSNTLRGLLDPAEPEEVAAPDISTPADETAHTATLTKKLWDAVENSISSDNSTKEKTFVEFISRLLADTAILHPLAKAKWSSDRESELDLVFECVCNKPLWASSKGVVPVECKNWSSRVGAPEITRFGDKVDRTGSKIGIFAARQFTDAAWSATAKARLRHDVVVGLLSDDDYVPYLEGAATATKVVESSLVRSILL